MDIPAGDHKAGAAEACFEGMFTFSVSLWAVLYAIYFWISLVSKNTLNS